MATFMIKSAVFPFHFWQPDFHAAAPTAVSAMLSSVVVKLGVYGFLRMTTLLFVAQAPQIQAILVVLGVTGVIFGGLSAIGTHNVKRMLAYSTLAQIGFILVGIGWGTPFSLMAAIIFAFNHSVIKAAMLMLAGYVASHAPVKSAAFDIVTGTGRRLPAAGLLFFIGSLALAGIPPTNGFVSKMTLFASGLDAERFWSLLFIGVTSIFTLIYTTRAFQRIWWQQPGGMRSASDAADRLPVGSDAASAASAEFGKRNEAGTSGSLALGSQRALAITSGDNKRNGDRLLAPAILVALMLILGIWAEPLVATAKLATAWLGDPALYIAAVLGG
jgi:multicomponent Na+:H+ antiporter subunit D